MVPFKGGCCVLCGVIRPEAGLFITVYPSEAVKQGVVRMDTVKVIHDREGRTLTVWFGRP